MFSVFNVSFSECIPTYTIGKQEYFQERKILILSIFKFVLKMLMLLYFFRHKMLPVKVLCPVYQTNSRL